MTKGEMAVEWSDSARRVREEEQKLEKLCEDQPW